MIRRKTDETNIVLRLNGSEGNLVSTSNKMLDHLLIQMARHGDFTLEVLAKGDNLHHIVEDVALCLGQAFRESNEEVARLGITTNRVGHSIVPMDDAIALVAVDFSNRGFSVVNIPSSLVGGEIGDGLTFTNIAHFLDSFAKEGKFNLHAIILYGEDNHHMTEALFKALGRALKVGCSSK